MTPTQFRAALKALGWSQAEAARQMRVNARTLRGWAAGRSPVPGPVQVLLAERITGNHGNPDMTDQPKLTKRQIMGLREVARYSQYFWMPATMRELEALGYTEAIKGTRAYRITDAGRARARELTP